MGWRFSTGISRASLMLGLAIAQSHALAAPDPVDRLEALDTDIVCVETSDGRVHEFGMYIARTDAERRAGLMFVESLAADRGMMFLYEPPQPVAMWMKNTPLSLDMLFVREDGRIEAIAASTQPFSEQRYATRKPVSAVIELNAGTAATLGIRPGDRVLHAWFARQRCTKAFCPDPRDYASKFAQACPILSVHPTPSALSEVHHENNDLQSPLCCRAARARRLRS
ncbi:hypothetical protein BH24PSE2_BH24PSE2_02340 [soil metagenome]